MPPKEEKGGNVQGNTPPKNDPVVQVPQSVLTAMQEQMAVLEKKDADREAQMAGFEAMIEAGKSAEGSDDPKLRKGRSFEPKFRTVRIRKYPIAGIYEDQGYVIGWTSRGAYQEVDRTGITPQVVDFIDVIFLGHEKTAEGKIKAEKVRLLDLMNKSTQVHCKILDTKKIVREEPTGEEIDVSTFDPQHGLVATGEKVDGYTAYTDITHVIQIPGVTEPVAIDAMFCN